MREIKFRVWDKINKRINNRCDGFISSSGDFYVDTDPTGINMNGRISIGKKDHHYEFAGLYTGLKDKNGKEIYEGDVLMYIGTNMSSMVVKFDNGCFVGEGPFNTLPLKSYLDATDFESIEIIGNIYENSELSPIF